MAAASTKLPPPPLLWAAATVAAAAHPEPAGARPARPGFLVAASAAAAHPERPGPARNRPGGVAVRCPVLPPARTRQLFSDMKNCDTMRRLRVESLSANGVRANRNTQPAYRDPLPFGLSVSGWAGRILAGLSGWRAGKADGDPTPSEAGVCAAGVTRTCRHRIGPAAGGAA